MPYRLPAMIPVTVQQAAQAIGRAHRHAEGHKAAGVYLADAECHFRLGEHRKARDRALESLSLAVGIAHADYRDAAR